MVWTIQKEKVELWLILSCKLIWSRLRCSGGTVPVHCCRAWKLLTAWRSGLHQCRRSVEANNLAHMYNSASFHWRPRIWWVVCRLGKLHAGAFVQQCGRSVEANDLCWPRAISPLECAKLPLPCSVYADPERAAALHFYVWARGHDKFLVMSRTSLRMCQRNGHVHFRRTCFKGNAKTCSKAIPIDIDIPVHVRRCGVSPCPFVLQEGVQGDYVGLKNCFLSCGQSSLSPAGGGVTRINLLRE
eukprot:1161376-Pelagomonas_calceolata.AAC.3